MRWGLHRCDAQHLIRCWAGCNQRRIAGVFEGGLDEYTNRRGRLVRTHADPQVYTKRTPLLGYRVLEGPTAALQDIYGGQKQQGHGRRTKASRHASGRVEGTCLSLFARRIAHSRSVPLPSIYTTKEDSLSRDKRIPTGTKLIGSPTTLAPHTTPPAPSV